jgi:hypothetical protein
VSRRRLPGHDRWLRLRIGLFFVAAGFLLLSMALDRRAYAIPAVVIAIAALLMRFLPGDVDEEGGAGDER